METHSVWVELFFTFNIAPIIIPDEQVLWSAVVALSHLTSSDWRTKDAR